MFDSAGSVLLVDIVNGRERQREERQLTRTDIMARAGEFLKLGADVLICGAISAPLEAALCCSNVKVIGFVCGTVNEVLAAFLSGDLANPEFGMPGAPCRCRLGPRRDIRARGLGRGAGQADHGGGRGGNRCERGSMGSPLATGPGGLCVCPACGEKVQHRQRQPCNPMTCPKCGAKMTRT